MFWGIDICKRLFVWHGCCQRFSFRIDASLSTYPIQLSFKNIYIPRWNCDVARVSITNTFRTFFFSSLFRVHQKYATSCHTQMLELIFTFQDSFFFELSPISFLISTTANWNRRSDLPDMLLFLTCFILFQCIFLTLSQVTRHYLHDLFISIQGFTAAITSFSEISE